MKLGQWCHLDFWTEMLSPLLLLDNETTRFAEEKEGQKGRGSGTREASSCTDCTVRQWHLDILGPAVTLRPNGVVILNYPSEMRQCASWEAADGDEMVEVLTTAHWKTFIPRHIRSRWMTCDPDPYPNFTLLPHALQLNQTCSTNNPLVAVIRKDLVAFGCSSQSPELEITGVTGGWIMLDLRFICSLDSGARPVWKAPGQICYECRIQRRITRHHGHQEGTKRAPWAPRLNGFLRFFR